MSIAAVSSTMSTPSVARTPETVERPGPDHDGDADDKSVGAPAAVLAAPPGMGKAVDTSA